MERFKMKRVMLTAALILLAPLAFTDARAEDPALPITPGMYTVTSTTSSNLNPDPSTKIMDVCIDEQVIDPSSYLPSNAHCSLQNVKKDGNKASFDIVCKGGESATGKPGLPDMTGKGDCSTEETALYCHFKMVGVVNDREFSIDSVREGKRIGECPDVQ
jgi:uncharacterized protein DUF3617